MLRIGAGVDAMLPVGAFDVLRFLTLRSLHSRFLLHLVLNAYWDPLRFELPLRDGDLPVRWRCCIDTAAASPDDCRMWEEASDVDAPVFVVQPRSLVVLASRLEAGGGEMHA